MSALPELQEHRGKWAEEALRLQLREADDIEFFCRPEWLVVPKVGCPFLCEAKGQEAFEPPPFKGHGLPIYQADHYERIRQKLGLRTRLVVYDPAGVRYSAWLDELEARGPKFIYETNGERRRRIYELGGFHSQEYAA